jgi:hypothetical protein
MKKETLDQLRSQDWEDIIPKLYSHTIYRMKWFGLTSELRLKGHEFKDLAHEAITLVFEGKRKWNLSKNPDLLEYLKNVINSLIWNLMASKERSKLSALDISEGIPDTLLFDEMLEMDIINKDQIDKIEDTLLNNEPMWLVFSSLIEGYKPQEIVEKYDLDIQNVRNIQKKLRRHITNILDLKK